MKETRPIQSESKRETEDDEREDVDESHREQVPATESKSKSLDEGASTIEQHRVNFQENPKTTGFISKEGLCDKDRDMNGHLESGNGPTNENTRNGNATCTIVVETDGVVNAAFSENAEEGKKKVHGEVARNVNGETQLSDGKAHFKNTHTNRDSGLNIESAQRRNHRTENTSKNTDDDVPTYLPVRSRRGLEFGSEKLITDADLLLAATLVADAMEGHKFEAKREPRFIRSYNYFKSIYLRVPLYAAIIVTLLLTLFEKPAVQPLSAPYWVTMIIEGACVLYFIFRICHHAHWRLNRGFKKDLKMLIAIICIIMTVVDMMVYVLVVKLTSWEAIRWSRILRPLLIMNFSDGIHLKRAWANIRMTLKQIAHVIVLFYFLIAVFSLVAMKMFQHRTDLHFPDGSKYFKDYIDSFWNLYVLVTTANNPDVMMPAYDSNRWYCLFFTIYIILCLYLMLNILLAVTYNSYRENMKDQIKHSSQMKKNLLHQAFEVIKINVDGKEMVTYKTWIRLIRLAHPGKTMHQIDLLMMVLDTDQSGYISRHQFLNIADLLNVPISQVSERKTCLEIYFTRFYMLKACKLLRSLVDSMYFSLCYDLIVIINVALICFDVGLAEWFFLGLYLAEIALKVFTFGVHRYFLNFQNWTDIILTLISLLVLIVTDFKLMGKTNTETLSVLNVFRIFRVLRCLVEFERFRIIFDAVFNVSFSIFTYCCILFIVFYCFAILGMEIFNGKIEHLGYNGTDPSDDQMVCNNKALNGSVFSSNRYCTINFNDIISSFVVLASLLIGNNWHVICEGYTLVTSKAARIFFMSFHLCVAVVVMNIVTAFILDMFMYEYTFQKKGNIDTKVEQTIKNLQIGIDDETGRDITKDSETKEQDDKERPSMFHTKSMFRKLTIRHTTPLKPNLSRYDGIRFHIKKRGWTKTELLLQQLFELEDEANEAADDEHKLRSMSLSK